MHHSLKQTKCLQQLPSPYNHPTNAMKLATEEATANLSPTQVLAHRQHVSDHM